MLRCATKVLAAASLAALLLAPASALEGRGFLSRRALHAVPGSGEPDARGGYSMWLRVRSDHSFVQGISVWFKGLGDAEGATLWMAKPGGDPAEEVADFAVSLDEDGGGSGVWTVEYDSRRSENPEFPLGLDPAVRESNVMSLFGGPVEVHVADGVAGDLPVLQGTVGRFSWRDDLGAGGGTRGERSRRIALRRPPSPAVAPDEAASGKARIFRRRPRGASSPGYGGFTVFAQGLATEDQSYEVWVEDGEGTPQLVGSTDATGDGLAWFSFDSRSGAEIPDELDAEDVRDLGGRRLELRRAGYPDYSLAGVLPRIR